MMTTTPPMTTTTTDEFVEEQFSVQAGGIGLPGMDVPPSAKAGSGNASAQRSVKGKSSRLVNVVSPVIEVSYRGGIASARTPDYNTPRLSDLERYKHLMRCRDFDAAISLCRERLLTARTELETLRWTKDAAIVENARGRSSDALMLLSVVHPIARRVTGEPRGKYENELGRAHELLGRYMPAFRFYKSAWGFFKDVGALVACAGVDNNRGRAYTFAGRAEASLFYLDRAAAVAERFGNIPLLGEVSESRALALEALGRLREARKAASYSVYLLADTDELGALGESRATCERLFRAEGKGK